jgi:hypothetical protein
MILAGVNQKGILLEEQAEDLRWKGRQAACSSGSDRRDRNQAENARLEQTIRENLRRWECERNVN